MKARTLLIALTTLQLSLTTPWAFSQSDPGLAEVDASEISAGPPPKALPSEPGWGYWERAPQAWLKAHQRFLRELGKRPISVLFIGDSLIKGWRDDGKAVWTEQFAALDAANFGIGGDSTRQILWRIQHGTLEGISPKVVVLEIGTNNLYGNENGGTPAEISAGIAKIIGQVRAKCPGAKVLLVGIFPRENGKFDAERLAVNALSAKLENGGDVRYLDMDAKFQTPDRKVIPELYKEDLVHLSPKGYEVWAQALQPLLTEMLK